MPDPNRFDGDVRIRALDEQQWRTLPVSAGYRDSGRGYGLADMAATPHDVQHRTNGQLAFHVLDVMESLLASAQSGQAVTVHSTCQRPAAVSLAPSLDSPKIHQHTG